MKLFTRYNLLIVLFFLSTYFVVNYKQFYFIEHKFSYNNLTIKKAFSINSINYNTFEGICDSSYNSLLAVKDEFNSNLKMRKYIFGGKDECIFIFKYFSKKINDTIIAKAILKGLSERVYKHKFDHISSLEQRRDKNKASFFKQKENLETLFNKYQIDNNLRELFYDLFSNPDDLLSFDEEIINKEIINNRNELSLIKKYSNNLDAIKYEVSVNLFGLIQILIFLLIFILNLFGIFYLINSSDKKDLKNHTKVS